MMRVTVGNANLGEKEKAYVNQVLDSGIISMGDFVRRFEEEFAKYIGAKEAVSVGTGTAADKLALYELVADGRAKPGDEVILPALTFISTANAVVHAGLKPVFADVLPENYTLDPGAAKKKITDRTCAIMPVHLMGHPAEMSQFLEIGKEKGIEIIEDAAEAHGAEYKGKKVGSLGAAGAFSFYVAHIITSAEGGMIVTNEPARAERYRSLRAHGRSCACKTCCLLRGEECPIRLTDDIDKRFHFVYKGFSEKMNELEAAIGLAQLEKIDETISARAKNFKFLYDGLSSYDELELLLEGEGTKLSPLAFPIVLKSLKRSDVIGELEKHGVETRPLFGCIPTQQPAYKDMGHKIGDFPVSERLGENAFYIGCHQGLKKDDLQYALDTFKKILP